MNKRGNVQIELVDDIDHMLKSLGIPHRVVDHNGLEILHMHLEIQASYGSWSDTVTVSIWRTENNDESKVIWGMTTPYESMYELMNDLHAVLAPLTKQYKNGKTETRELVMDNAR